MAVGIKQKDSVDDIVQKFLLENFTIILFHYDGNVREWWDLQWSNAAIHIAAHNQTKLYVSGCFHDSVDFSGIKQKKINMWFAKRFLYPDILSIYDYIFLWDEYLGVEDFNPARLSSSIWSAFSCTEIKGR